MLSLTTIRVKVKWPIRGALYAAAAISSQCSKFKERPPRAIGENARARPARQSSRLFRPPAADLGIPGLRRYAQSDAGAPGTIFRAAGHCRQSRQLAGGDRADARHLARA